MSMDEVKEEKQGDFGGLEARGMAQQKSLRKGHSAPKLLGLLATADKIYLKHTRHVALFCFSAQKGLEPKA